MKYENDETFWAQQNTTPEPKLFSGIWSIHGINAATFRPTLGRSKRWAFISYLKRILIDQIVNYIQNRKRYII